MGSARCAQGPSGAALAAARGRGRAEPSRSPPAAPCPARLPGHWKEQQHAALEGSRETDRTHVQTTALRIDGSPEWCRLNVSWSFRVPEDIGFHEIVWVT